jgi:hypothetical protein
MSLGHLFPAFREKTYFLHFGGQDFSMNMKTLQTSGLTHPTTQRHFLSNTVVQTARLISNNFIYSVFSLNWLDITRRLSCFFRPVAPTVFNSRLQMKQSHHSVARFQNGRELEIPDSYKQFPSNRHYLLIPLSKISVSNLLLLLCTIPNKCTTVSQIITLLHVSTLSCHPQGPCNQYLAKLHKYLKCSCC